jgi:putative membrane protein
MRNKLTSIGLLFLGGYFVYLKVTRSLAFYIRPEQEMFTAVMGGFLMLAATLTLVGKEHEEHGQKTYFDTLTLVLIFVFVIAGIFVPLRSLSSDTATRRGNGTNNQISLLGNDEPVSISPLFEKIESMNYSIADWYQQFRVNPEPESYIGNEVSLDGFVEPMADGNFKVTRFVLTCCIVDAYPIGIYVDKKMEGLQKNEWIRVKGKFITKEIDGNRIIAVSAETIEKIANPENPYY